MPKKKKAVPPETRMEFEAALDRIKEIAGCRTQLELAKFLDVRQSSISDSKISRQIDGTTNNLTLWR